MPFYGDRRYIGGPVLMFENCLFRPADEPKLSWKLPFLPPPGTPDEGLEDEAYPPFQGTWPDFYVSSCAWLIFRVLQWQPMETIGLLHDEAHKYLCCLHPCVSATQVAVQNLHDTYDPAGAPHVLGVTSIWLT
jgi:hypothetical protein